MTGILNRRAVFAFGNQLAALRSDDRPALSILMIDVEHLKEINDVNGHQSGDQVLTEVSELLTSAVRSGDVVGRYGGDEFLAILIGGEPSDTDAICERILSGMRDARFSSSRGEIAVSVSIGISELSPSENDLCEVLGRADHALYESKRHGRATFTRA
ncbi:MAG: GGDEF domain-containing protein [Acidimicrobiaceae bacterium]|nr:GGDEF domain-containing protein [Acidimicrobiaceae bacterium]